ncbi:Histidine kinase-, DNA gyrase B-, and HSP90-like ATPase [Syntrophus gentianae]|uniref:Histidine kinase-, DNA gyrase B-, and HSP90-like ATPase n=1 Tax=Syntrophus gentianae TaxID=43775 RepID=A0A1H7UC28_9BACT|nr:ATP-binding protein [Syntrophus gentianae]SEL94521.1 Histidine kinase-, DNA gyrase B-, and HSP90-like ATPase [Syntrophus gentianae]
MDTYFAPAEKAKGEELTAEIEMVCHNPVLEGLLCSVSGLLAVLNEHRQLVAFNDTFMQMLGIHDAQQAFGLRLGEALECIHAHDEPAGCGTTKFCPTCGAAIAIVSSLTQDRPVERMCALSANRDGQSVDIALLVRSYPIRIAGKIFLLIFLQDISRQQQRAALERAFFHDVNNMLSALVWASELLVQDNPSVLAQNIYEASLRLHSEVAIQRCLSQGDSSSYQPVRRPVNLKQILGELYSFFASHPAANKKKIEFPEDDPNISINTDLSLLLHVLFNMVINALEATGEAGTVKIWCEHKGGQMSFNVWNAEGIPQEISHRIFQRNFSTKEQAGRGIGTFSMKLFGEKILGGRVTFSTSQEEGTVFTFSLPFEEFSSPL